MSDGAARAPAQASDDRWQLFLRNRQMLADYVRCLVRNDPDAEDIFQEVALQIVRHETGPEVPERFASWCRGIARNFVLHHWRSQRRGKLVFRGELLDMIDQAFDEEDPNAELWARRRWALGLCLGELGGPDRELLQRRYFEGAGSEALAQRLRLTPDAIRMRIMRLRQALSRCIDRRLAAEAPGER